MLEVQVCVLVQRHCEDFDPKRPHADEEYGENAHEQGEVVTTVMEEEETVFLQAVARQKGL